MPSATIIIERPALPQQTPPRLWIELLDQPRQSHFQSQSQPQSQLRYQENLHPQSAHQRPQSLSPVQQCHSPSALLSTAAAPPPAGIMSMTTTTTTTTSNSTTATTTSPVTTSANSSFPRRTTFHRIIGSITFILILASMALVASKRCTEPVATESDIRAMTTASGVDISEAPSQAATRSFVAGYYYQLHLLHLFSLSSSFLIILFSCLDLVPTRDDDIKYAFHFVSVFAIFCIAFATLYAAFLAFTRPCGSEGACCSYRPTASLLAATDSKKAITAISDQDVTMSAILVLDTVAGLLQLLVAVVYFRDVRTEAAECGYLYRVHNEGYIIR